MDKLMRCTAGVGVAAVLLAGCTGRSGPSAFPSGPAGTVTASITRTVTAGPSSSISRAASTTGSSAQASLQASTRPGPEACATSSLRLGPGHSNGAGGTNYLTFALLNTGQATCTLFGYPGVSVLDAAGHLVQQPAVRNSRLDLSTADTGTLTLAPGGSASFILAVTDTDPDPDCTGVRTGTQLRVYPPNQTQPILQQGHFQACRAQVSHVFTH